MAAACGVGMPRHDHLGLYHGQQVSSRAQATAACKSEPKSNALEHGKRQQQQWCCMRLQLCFATAGASLAVCQVDDAPRLDCSC
jgi:hypothetical protein